MKKRLSSNNFSKAQLICFVAVFAIIGAFILLKSQAAGSAANIWVDTDGGTCTRSQGTVAYDTTTACGSFQAAYAAAQPGDLVFVKAGTYGSAYINDDPAKDSATLSAVTIQAAPGETVIWGNGSLHAGTCHVNTSNNDVCASNINFVDIRFGIGGLHTHEGVNITLTNTTIGNGMYVLGTQNFKMIGGQVGPADSNGGSGDGVVLGCENSGVGVVCDDTLGKLRPTATFDGVTFTHINKTVNLDAHTDCLQTTSFKSLTIINSTFTACADAPIILGDENVATGYNSTLLIRNNFIGAGVDSGQGITTATRYAGSLVIEYNTIIGATNISIPVTFRGNAISGTFSSTTCNQMITAGASLTYNVWGSGSVQCGATNFIAPTTFGFANPAADPIDLHIGQTSPLVDKGDPANCPATDIDGDQRPQGTVCDAGADEYPTTANVWVSTTGNDSTCVRGDQSKPCQTPGKAWSIAASGDVINVADGDYMNGCTLTGAKTNDTIFTGTPAARFICTNNANSNPLFARHLHLNGVQHMVINGLTIGRISSEQTAGTIDHNTIHNLAITCQDSAPWPLESPGQKCSAQIQLVGSNWLFDNVSIGPGYDSGSCGGTGDANKFPVSNSLFRNVTFHDQRYQRYVALPHTSVNFCNTGVDAQHTENIFMTGSNGLTLDGMIITNGANSGYVDEQGLPSGTGPDTGAIFLTSNGNSTPSNLTIRNCSVLGAGSTFSGGSTAPLLNTLIENCTLPSGAVFQCDSTHCPGGYQSLTLRNNIFGTPSGICPIAAALGSSGGNMNDHNLFVYTGSGGSASQCGNTNLVSPGGFSTIIRAAAGTSLTWDLHLVSGSLAVDNADPINFAAYDKDGYARPCGSSPDIGAYEFNCTSTTPPPTPKPGDINSDGHVNILDLSILLSHYGQVASSSQGDCNSDGRVSVLDLSILLSHYGS